jgi:hypothetical protein
MLRWVENHGLGWLAVGSLLLAPTSCKEPNPSFDGPASAGSGSEGSGTTGTTGTPDTTTDVITTMTTDGTSATSLEPGSSSGPVPSESSSSSETGDEGPLYPPCMLDEDPVCPRPYEACYEFLAPDYTACTLPCEQNADCPQPATGDAPAVCAGQNEDQCVIDCSDGAACPDGMECQEVGGGGMFERCLWPS